jgi:hypothetical protein
LANGRGASAIAGAGVACAGALDAAACALDAGAALGCVLAPGGSPGPTPRYEDVDHAGGASAAQDGCERRVCGDPRPRAEDNVLCSLLDAVDAALVDAREALLVACDEALASLVKVGIGQRGAAEVARLCFGDDAAGASRAG